MVVMDMPKEPFLLMVLILILLPIGLLGDILLARTLLWSN